MNTMTRDWEKEFDSIFGNRISVNSETGDKVFFKQRVDLIKSFISTELARARTEEREAILREVEGMHRTGEWKLNAALSDLATLLRGK